MNNNEYPWYLSWPAIIVALLFFWPAGIALIVLRTQNNKGSLFAGTTNKKFYIVIGVILILFGFTRFDSSAMVALFMIIGGGVLIFYANALAKKAERNKKYIDMIVNQRETSMDKIAGLVNVKYDVVVKELKTLQSLGVLKGVTINETTHSITLPQVQQTGQTNQNVKATMNAAFGNISTGTVPQQPATVEAVCPGCGAKYTGLKGSACTCDYCGSNFVH